MSHILKRTAAAAVMAAIVGGSAFAAQAAAGKVGDTQMCVPLHQINDTQVIDDKIILIKMYGGSYKRMDLLSSCPGLKMSQGFAHATSTNDLCIQDPLRVLQPVGATCMIDKIVNIDKDEAKALLARR